ncbi:hypothetical protein GGF37_006925 [Kickxella alabastrina]|nr:hypothetical protein GGF37_006925 [Kickxella alabastrina]
MSVRKYSLWVCPPSHSLAHALLDGVISKFSSSLSTPRFPPHATLVSPVYAASDSSAIAQVTNYVKKLHEQLGTDIVGNGIPVCVQRVATGIKFYQCVLLEAPGSDVLVAANGVARGHWGINRDVPVFYAHVSLVYGEFEGEELARVAERVGAGLPGDFEESLSFVATEIRVIETVGSCDQWRDIGGVSIILDK